MHKNSCTFYLFSSHLLLPVGSHFSTGKVESRMHTNGVMSLVLLSVVTFE